MGIGLATLWTFGLLAAGTGATWWLELRLLRGQPELGPAAPLHVTPDRRTDKRDPWMYYAGPVLALMGVAWGALCIPFSETLVVADVGVGLFYFIVVVDFAVLGISLGGWARTRRTALRRATASSRSYWPTSFHWGWQLSGRS